MRTRELKVARIGNSRGVRLPAETLRRYGIGEVVRMEERVDGILLLPRPAAGDTLAWEETAREMAASRESWSEWDITAGDGLSDLAWDSPASAAAGPGASYGVPPVRGRGRRHRSAVP